MTNCDAPAHVPLFMATRFTDWVVVLSRDTFMPIFLYTLISRAMAFELFCQTIQSPRDTLPVREVPMSSFMSVVSFVCVLPRTMLCPIPPAAYEFPIVSKDPVPVVPVIEDPHENPDMVVHVGASVVPFEVSTCPAVPFANIAVVHAAD